MECCLTLNVFNYFVMIVYNYLFKYFKCTVFRTMKLVAQQERLFIKTAAGLQNNSYFSSFPVPWSLSLSLALLEEMDGWAIILPPNNILRHPERTDGVVISNLTEYCSNGPGIPCTCMDSFFGSIG